MTDRKQDIVDMLHELAELTMLDENVAQSFRVRAYEGAAHAVVGVPGDVTRLSEAELQTIPGIGKATSSKIRELLEHGKVKKLESLRAKHPASVVALLRLPGLGPKAVNRLRAELGVESIDALREAIASHRIRALKGFGDKSEDKLAHALTRLEAQGSLGRTPISVALPLAERVVARLLEVPGVSHASYCGSLRRFSETIGDVDVVVAATDAPAVMEALVSMSVVDRVLARGDSKTSVVTRRGTQIDLRVVADKQLGAARLYFTGSKGHNIKLRQRALARGWTLNEYALSEIEGGKPRRRSTRRSASPGSPPCSARTRGRSRPPSEERCPTRSPPCAATSTSTRRCLATGTLRSRRSSSSRRREATGCWPSPTTPRGRSPAWGAIDSSSSAPRSAPSTPSSATR
jgi:DNA polymerase (family 10)